MRPPRMPVSAYSSAAFDTNSFSSFGSWYAWPVMSTAFARFPIRRRMLSAILAILVRAGPSKDRFEILHGREAA